MTIREVLTTTQRRTGRLVRNNGQARMEYNQIQFTSDCIRRYAINRGTRIDEAFTELKKAGGIDIISRLYIENPHQKIGIAVRKLEKMLGR